MTPPTEVDRAAKAAADQDRWVSCASIATRRDLYVRSFVAGANWQKQQDTVGITIERTDGEPPLPIRTGTYRQREVKT